MHSMRDIIMIVEARKGKPAAFPVVDTTALYGEITSLESILSGMGFRFKPDWINETMESVKQKKLSHDRMEAEEREHDPESFQPTQFDAKDAFRDWVSDVVKRGSLQHRIYSELNTAERVYQDNFIDPDNPDSYVESSAYLSALAAQKDVGSALLSLEATKPSTWGPVIQGTKQVLDAFKAFNADHEKYEPEWMDSVSTELGLLLPTMRFMLKNGIVR